MIKHKMGTQREIQEGGGLGGVGEESDEAHDEGDD